MNEYIFICADCGQEIEVNETMREAIVANGCPVCATAVSDEEFSD